MLEVLRDNLASLTSYGLLGIALLIVGFGALDLVTPGRLRNLVWVEHRRNAVILTTSMVIGLSLVLISSVLVSDVLVLWRGVLYTAVYGIVAIALMMFSFVLIDLLTPGKLGTLLLDDDEHPAGWVSAAVFIAIGAVMAAALLG